MILDSEYVLKTGNAEFPVTIAEVNGHLKESFASFVAEPYMFSLMRAVEKYGEMLTRREFLTKTFTVYLTGWAYEYEIRKSKLQAITSLKYLDDDDVSQTVDATEYDTTFTNDFATFYFVDTYDFPAITTNNKQPVRIEFTAGYGVDNTSVPDTLKVAMLNHLARLWQERGDCPKEGSAFKTWIDQALPQASKIIYALYRIENISI